MKRIRGLGPVAALAAFSLGCSALVATEAPREGQGSWTPVPMRASAAPGALLPASALAGAGEFDEIEPETVDLPGLPSWPRYYRFQGPIYALVQLEPFVGQLGILADTERADSGMGFGALFGYRMPSAGGKCLGFEGMIGMSNHKNVTSAVDAHALRLTAAARLSFNADEKTVPFVVGGAGFYSLKFDRIDPKYHLKGLGALVGGGVEWASGGSFSSRVELTAHFWDAAQEDGNGGMATTLALGLGAAMSF